MTAPSVTLHSNYLRILWPESHADYHFRWLRHNCDIDRHPATGERIVDSSELPEELPVRSACAKEDGLRVVWDHDGRESFYAWDWLKQNAYAMNRSDVPPPSDVSSLTIDAGSRSWDDVLPEAWALVERCGAAVMKRAGTNFPEASTQTEAFVVACERRELKVVETHFGRIEDLRTDNSTNKNTDQLGYTNAAVDAHTDQPYLEKPPRYQALHSIRAAEAGGESLVVDVLRAFHYLQSLDSLAAKLIAETPVHFYRKQKAFERSLKSPLVTLEPEFMVRYSYFTMAPHQLPFDRMEAWYRAYDRFARIVRSPGFQYRFLLAPGDLLIYDNHRMLHGRTSFRGARWVRGIYFDPA
jgi:gamma-butyrobetaine dioxygenase/trimethyllysine dioxygenase